jgi:hypothetical protein
MGRRERTVSADPCHATETHQPLKNTDGLQVALLQAIAQLMTKELDHAGFRVSGTAPAPHDILNRVGIQVVGNSPDCVAQAMSKFAPRYPVTPRREAD